MSALVTMTGMIGFAVVVVATAITWYSARPLVHASARRRSGAAQARVVGRSAIEELARLDTLVVDPIGSITVGELRVVGVEPLDPEHDRSLRWFAGALQHGTDDPVARAIARLSGRGGATNVEHVPGIGVLGTVDRHPVRVGSPEWIGLEGAADDGWGRTVAVEVDGRALGRILVADSVREQAAGTLEALAADGWRVVVVAANEAALQHLAAAVPAATVVRVGDTPGPETAVIGSVARSQSALDPPPGLRVTVSDRLDPATVGVEMNDVAIHHVAAVLRLLRGARGRLRAMRHSVLAVAVAGLACLVLVPTGPPEAAATAATVAALPIALLLPLTRWS